MGLSAKRFCRSGPWVGRGEDCCGVGVSTGFGFTRGWAAGSGGFGWATRDVLCGVAAGNSNFGGSAGTAAGGSTFGKIGTTGVCVSTWGWAGGRGLGGALAGTGGAGFAGSIIGAGAASAIWTMFGSGSGTFKAGGFMSPGWRTV